jgi:hypothetical protein
MDTEDALQDLYKQRHVVAHPGVEDPASLLAAYKMFVATGNDPLVKHLSAAIDAVLMVRALS